MAVEPNKPVRRIGLLPVHTCTLTGLGPGADGYEGLKLAMFEAKIRYVGLVFRFWRPQNLKEHTWFWVR